MTNTSFKGAKRDPEDAHPGSVVWYLSFGDLLTLLLCFFLVLTPWEKLKERAKSESVHALGSSDGESSEYGTTLASTTPLRGSVVLQELPIWKSREGRESGVSGAILNESAEVELAQFVSEGAKVEILVCDSRVDRVGILREFAGLFHRVVGDDSGFRIHISSSCEGIEVLSPVTREIIGRIRVTGT